MEESLGSRLSSQEAIAARNKEEAMPPSSVYIDRTTETRFKGSGAVRFLLWRWYWSWPPPREHPLLAPSLPNRLRAFHLSACPTYVPEDWRQIREAPAA